MPSTGMTLNYSKWDSVPFWENSCLPTSTSSEAGKQLSSGVSILPCFHIGLVQKPSRSGRMFGQVSWGMPDLVLCGCSGRDSAKGWIKVTLHAPSSSCTSPAGAASAYGE